MIAERISRLQQELSAGEAMLVESLPNRQYLTGFASSAGMVAVMPNRAVFFIDFRYVEMARQVVKGCEVILAKQPDRQLRELLTAAGCKRLYIETETTSVARHRRLTAQLPETEISADDRLSHALTAQRSCKSAAEIACIRTAQAMTEETFSYILPRITPGRTEREIMLDMEFYMRRLGSDGVAFDFIVVSGKNSSLPHGTPTDKPVAAGEFVTMDFGAVVEGYRSDMTRTVAVGRADEDMRRVYNTVLEAQQLALAAIRPGVACDAVDKIAREYIDKAGYVGCFGHGLGHSVGLEIHESPSFSPHCDTRLAPGHMMTVEPGIYLENRFGVRIEDMVLVTGAGCENLTAAKKELLII